MSGSSASPQRQHVSSTGSCVGEVEVSVAWCVGAFTYSSFKIHGKQKGRLSTSRPVLDSYLGALARPLFGGTQGPMPAGQPATTRRGHRGSAGHNHGPTMARMETAAQAGEGPHSIGACSGSVAFAAALSLTPYSPDGRLEVLSLPPGLGQRFQNRRLLQGTSGR
jgi:hypothetical protein